MRELKGSIAARSKYCRAQAMSNSPLTAAALQAHLNAQRSPRPQERQACASPRHTRSPDAPPRPETRSSAEEEVLALEILLLALELAHQALLLLRGHRRRRRGQAREKIGQEVLALLRQGQLDCRAEARVQHRLELHHTDLPGLPHLVAEGRADHRELSAGSHALRESITVLGDGLDVDVSAVPLLELNAQGQAALHLPGLTVHLLLRESADLIGVQRVGAGVEVKRVLEDVVAERRLRCRPSAHTRRHEALDPGRGPPACQCKQQRNRCARRGASPAGVGHGGCAWIGPAIERGFRC
mmetsp:Transcript_106005/g.338470  ORF Transcript_106005/g.338470 Transcript_106005/m.338470 type:complete len:298 (+) Transcript_106005:131-1024(+)